MFIGSPKLDKLASMAIYNIANGDNMNILIVGKSGYGKTTLALHIAKNAELSWELCYGFNPRIRANIVIVDEIHSYKGDFEVFYRLMDKRERTFIFTTTELGDLPEPFTNRCFIINIPEYKFSQLMKIAEFYNTIFTKSILKEIILRSRGVPRIIKSLIEHLDLYFRHNRIPVNIENAREGLNLLGFYEDGFTDYDYQYIKLLKDNGALSLSSIHKMLGLPKDTIENYVEPFLLKKNIIKITTKGRILMNGGKSENFNN